MPRDTAGNYTLPAGNPVASGEIIAASWANSTMNDLGQSLSASLDRYGRGGMLAPFQFTDGTESAPGATWSNEPTTGLYRAAYGDLRFTLTGTDVQRWTNANSYLWRNNQWEEIITSSGGGGSTTINDLVVTGSFTSPGIDDNATSTAITIDASQNVGIGYGSPSAKLHILDDAASCRMTVQGLGAGNSAGINILGRNSSNTSAPWTIQTEEDLSLSVGTGGSEAMRLTASGNVGIGNTNPTSKLTIGDGTADAAIQFPCATKNNFIGYDGSFDGLQLATNGEIKFQAGTSYTERMRIDSSGNVGIGTASPSSYYADKLVASVADESGITISCNSAHKAYLMFADGTTGSDAYRGWIGYDHALDELSLSSHDYIKFQSGGTTTERMRIDSSGNVGIGTASPLAKIHTQDTNTNSNAVGALLSNSAQGASDSASLNFGFGRTADSSIYSFIGVKMGKEKTWTGTPSEQDGYLAFHTVENENNPERMRINSSGNVLVGTTALSNAKFVVQGGGSTSATNATIMYNSTGAGLFYIRDDGAFNTGGAPSSPYFNTSATAANLVVNAAGFLERSTSSARYKENVRDYTGSIDALRPVMFNSINEDDDKDYAGFIAEEVHETGMVEFVQYDEQGRPDAVNYANMVALLVKEVQDLKAEVAALKGA